MGLSSIQIFIIFTGVLILYSIPTILCLVLIKKKDYKKLHVTESYAGFWWRVFAGLIDSIILIIVNIILSFIFVLLNISETVIEYIFAYIPSWLYFVILQSSEKRSTLGMRACGIKIHDEHFNRLSFWRLTGKDTLQHIYQH